MSTNPFYDESPDDLDDDLIAQVREILARESVEQDIEVVGAWLIQAPTYRWMRPGEFDPTVTAIIAQEIA